MYKTLQTITNIMYCSHINTLTAYIQSYAPTFDLCSPFHLTHIKYVTQSSTIIQEKLNQQQHAEECRDNRQSQPTSRSGQLIRGRFGNKSNSPFKKDMKRSAKDGKGNNLVILKLVCQKNIFTLHQFFYCLHATFNCSRVLTVELRDHTKL